MRGAAGASVKENAEHYQRLVESAIASEGVRAETTPKQTSGYWQSERYQEISAGGLRKKVRR
jgi:hypothetical protein